MATGQPNSLPKATTSSGEVSTSVRAGHARDAGPLGRVAGADLVAHDLDGLGRRADEGHAPLGDGPGEVGVLREEAVAGVDGVGPALLDDVEDGLGVEVALGRRLAPEGVGLVGQADVEGVAVELGVDGDRGHAQLPAGPDHPDGDLPPVGDEDLLQHAAPFESDGRRTVGAPPTKRYNTGTARRVCAMPGPRFTDVRRLRDHRLDQPLPARRGPRRRPRGGRGRRRPPDGRPRPAGPALGGAGRGQPARLRPAPARSCPPGHAPPGQRSAVALAAADAVDAVAGLDAGHQVAERPAGADGRQAGRRAGRGRPGRQPVRTRRPAAPVVVGIGINVNWPGDRRPPPELAASASSLASRPAGRSTGRPARPLCSAPSSPGWPTSAPTRAGPGWLPTCGPGARRSGTRVRVELPDDSVRGDGHGDHPRGPSGGRRRRTGDGPWWPATSSTCGHRAELALCPLGRRGPE